MSVNLLVWAWARGYATAAERRRRKLKHRDVAAAFFDREDHASMGEIDWSGFDAAIVREVGPEQVDGPYIVERHPKARVFNLRASRAPELVPRIGRLAHDHGLNAMEG